MVRVFPSALYIVAPENYGPGANENCCRVSEMIALPHRETIQRCTRRWSALLCAGLAALWGCVGVVGAQSSEGVTTAERYTALERSEHLNGLTVQLQGTVIHANPRMDKLL